MLAETAWGGFLFLDKEGRVVKRIWLLAIAVCALLAYAGAAHAQGILQTDHLKCYRASAVRGLFFINPHALDFLTLTPFQVPPFAVENECRIIPKSFKFCVPVGKQPSQAPSGQVLRDDYLCYKAKCPPEVDFRLGTFNQFTQGLIKIQRKTKAREICVPTRKLDFPPPPPFCGDGVINKLGEQCEPPGSACAGGFGVCDAKCKCLETDQFSNTQAEVEIRYPNAQTETLTMHGPTTVVVRLGGIHENALGMDTVETEMVAMELTGFSPLLGQPVTVRQSMAMPSMGAMTEHGNPTPGTLDVLPLGQPGTVDSFFDVFFDISVGDPQNPLMVLHNNRPKRMRTTITHKPPAEGETYEDPTPIELYDPNNNPTGIQIVGVRHTPNPPQLCGNGQLDPGEVCDISTGVFVCTTIAGVGTCNNNCVCIVP